MRVCFVVNSVRTQRPTYTTVHLAFAAHRRGHDVAFVSVDHLSHDGAHVWGALVRAQGERPRRPPSATSRGCARPTPPSEPERLDDFDVVFLRNNPNVGGPEGDGFNPAIEFGRRLKQSGVMVFNDPDGLVRAGLEDVPGRLPGGDPAAHADHPLGRAGAGVPARAGRPGHHQAAARASAGRTCSTSPGASG